MRPLILTAIALLTTFASAQTTGRHFRRDDRTPQTPAAAPQAPASDAAARTTTTKVVPLRKLRSGRAWPSYHFSRMPQNTTPAGDGPVDASTKTTTTQRRGFWRPRR
jgi:hypothetical protein